MPAALPTASCRATIRTSSFHENHHVGYLDSFASCSRHVRYFGLTEAIPTGFAAGYAMCNHLVSLRGHYDALRKPSTPRASLPLHVGPSCRFHQAGRQAERFPRVGASVRTKMFPRIFPKWRRAWSFIALPRSPTARGGETASTLGLRWVNAAEDMRPWREAHSSGLHHRR